MLLNTADDLKVGTLQVDAAYLGTVLVWPPDFTPPGSDFPFAKPFDHSQTDAEKWMPA